VAPPRRVDKKDANRKKPEIFSGFFVSRRFHHFFENLKIGF